MVNDYVLDNSAIRQNPGSIPASMWAFIGKDSNGKLNGHIYGNAQYYIYGFVPTYTYTQQLEDIAHYSSTYAAVGTTTANNGGTGAASVLDLFKAAADGDYLKIRANLWFSRTGAKTVHDAYGTDVAGASRELPKYAGKNNLVVVNGVKFLADGSPQLRTAYLTDQYKTPGSYPEGWAGAPYYATYSLLQNDVVEAHQDGFDQIHIHGNGDAAIDWILNAYAEVRQPQYRQLNNLRHTVIHSQFQREDQIERMSAMKVIPSFFPLHTYYLGDRHMDIFLGNERSWRMSACQDAVDRGMRFTIHSDSPVMAHNPLLVMWSAVNRISYGNRSVYTLTYLDGTKYRSVDQRIDPPDALRAMTIYAAYQENEEKIAGSIEVGKRADFVVLAENPLKVDPMRIKDIKVLETIVGGETVYKAEGK